MTDPDDPAGQPRRLLRRVDPLPAIVALLVVGVVVAATHHPRRGMGIVTVAVGLAAVLRLVLPPRLASGLVVRSRHVDVATLVALTVALATLVIVTPFPAGSG